MENDQNDHRKSRIGIDLGGTKIEVVVLGSQGQITLRRRTDTPKDNYQAIVSAIKNLVIETEREAGISHAPPIGIGTPGAVSDKTGMMKNCNSTCLNGMPLIADLSRTLNRRVRIANDADCLTLSEASDGAAARDRSVFGVILGTGVGGGICFDNHLLKGANSICGEWGHTTLPLAAYRPDDYESKTPSPSLPIESARRCFCGRVDCIETWLAGPGFERSFFELTGKRKSAVEIEAMIDDGDKEAETVFYLYCNLLALGLSSVINIVDPDAIVLGGGMSNMARLYPEVERLLPRYVFSDQVNTRVVKAKHGDSSGVRGAAWLWSIEELNQ